MQAGAWPVSVGVGFMAALRSPLLKSVVTVPLLITAALGGASASAAPSIALDRYSTADEQVTSISQFNDVKPTDWPYQALQKLVENYGCVAGYPNGTFAGGKAMTRYEAAALLNACLDRITEVTDALKKLMKEFEKELAVLKGRVDGLEARVGVLEANQFSTTTKLKGIATFVLGGNSFGGTSSATVAQNQTRFGATTFNYDLQLILDTSFTGKDLLRTTLRAGNFANTSMGGAGPSRFSQLEVAFQEDCGAGVNCGDVLAIDRLYYQIPIGEFTATMGGRVGQEDMLAIWPSVYPSETVLDVLTLNGAPGAYNKTLGAGAGLWWKRDGWAISASYVAAHGGNGNPQQGGIATSGASGTATVQMGYSAENWAIAAIYSSFQNGGNLAYATPVIQGNLANPGITTAVALSGSWQPASQGWIPSISAGWGINSTGYAAGVNTAGLVATSQSWSVGLQWEDAFVKGNAFGMAFGQPTFATSLHGGATPNDGNAVMEGWYRVQISDQISVTPALFYLSRPLGADTPAGTSFNQLGVLIKTRFRF